MQIMLNGGNKKRKSKWKEGLDANNVEPYVPWIYITLWLEKTRGKTMKLIFNYYVEPVMLKHLLMVASNNDGKPNDEKLSRWVWGEG